MRVLVIPEMTEPILLKHEVMALEDNLIKITPNLSIANLLSWSIFVKENKESSLEYLAAGYSALKHSHLFKSFDIYIGFLDKDDFEEVDVIIYTSAAAKEIFEIRVKDILPKAKETIIISKGNTVENEIYKRAIKYN